MCVKAFQGITVPSIFNLSVKSGIAGISFVFSPIISIPKQIPYLLEYAFKQLSGLIFESFNVSFLELPLSILPSKFIISISIELLFVYYRKKSVRIFSNSLGFIKEKTLSIVWELGIPPVIFRKRLKKSFLALMKSTISSQSYIYKN